MQHVGTFNDFLNEKKPAGAPKWKDSDAPDAEGRFRDLSIKDLAAWLIKTRDKDLKKISGSLTQQIVFNRNEDPEYAEKMEKTRKEVYRQLGREDLLENEAINEIGDSSANPFKWSVSKDPRKWIEDECNKTKDKEFNGSVDDRYHRVDPLEYTFKSDKTGASYYVMIKGLIGRNLFINIGDKKKPANWKDYHGYFNLSFSVESSKDSNTEEPETNLGEQYRVLATVTDCALNFLNTALNIPDLLAIHEFQMNPKLDTEGQTGVDSRRGKLYLAYIKNAFSKLKTSERYSIVNKKDGFSLIFNDQMSHQRDGTSVIKSWESMTFEQFVAEKESPYKEETLQKYKKEYEAGKEIPFGVKTSLIAQGMIPHEGGPDKGKKKKTDEYK
jgi:hypothetical protein